MTPLHKYLMILVGFPTFWLPVAPALVCAGTELSTEPSRPWPLPIEINLTSSFGEYRSRHLHAGVDIKTYGKEGVPCRAVGDGYVSRMRASPSGYGKAIYVKLSSGETVVYAHLSEFAPQLEEKLFEEQTRVGRYRVDLHFQPGLFTLTNGEIVGYTGSTGASAPHLHFEVRDEGENPVNPLSVGWKLADQSAPIFKAVAFVPLSRHSRVEGECRAKDVRLRRAVSGRYLTVDTLVVSGRLGMGAHIIDRLNGTSGRLAPYRVELTVDGVLLASITFERFTYSHTREVELAYDMAAVRGRGEHYLFLFRRSGESLWNRTFVNDGVIDTSVLPKLVGEQKDVYTAVIRTVDYAGNVSAALVPFRIAEQPSSIKPARAANAAATHHEEDVPGCFLFEGLLSVTPGLVSLSAGGEAITGHGAGDDAQTIFTVADFGPFSSQPVEMLDLVASGSASKAYVLPLQKGREITRRIIDLGIDVVAGAQSLYADTFLYVEGWRGSTVEKELGKNGLRAVAAPVRLGPLSLALRHPIQIRYRLTTAVDGREAVYRFDNKKREWTYESSQLLGDTVTVDVNSPGVYGVFIDADPPRIAKVTINNKKSYATQDLLRELVIRVYDVGSGVDDERSEVFLNGTKRIARWDGFSKKMFVSLRGVEVDGTNELSVIAFDRVGNETRVDTQLSFARADSKN